MITTEVDAGILTVTFNRPEVRNAMTLEMYDQLKAACRQADGDPGIKVMVLQGAGDAFIAGTDISEFRGLTAERAISYEHQITDVLDTLQQVGVPTIAAIPGACVGGGLGVAAACDLRVAGPSARFGIPIARTLGNCPAIGTLELLVSKLGQSRVAGMLLTTELINVDEARTAGFVHRIEDDPRAAARTLAEQLRGQSPLAMAAARIALFRLRRSQPLPTGSDLITMTYGSEDFAGAVRAILDHTDHAWTGR